jgi:outer membrane protein assembly factor BamB
MIHHKFMAIDEGLGNLLYVDERDGSTNWVVPIGQAQARDMQLIGENKLLISHHRGFSEFEIATGRKAWEFTGLEGVTAARRQPDGHTMVAGVGLAGAKGVVILELDADAREVHRAVFPGDYVRLIRQTRQGTYLMSCNDRIREGSRDGRYLREFQVDGFYHAWKSLRRPDGNLVVTAGYGAFVAELDPAGKILRKFGGKECLSKQIHPFFYAMFQLLPDGGIVLANWQGHGPGLGRSGVQLLEFNSTGELVWSWSGPHLVSSVQGVSGQALDGLDTTRLHDERDGVMKPFQEG